MDPRSQSSNIPIGDASESAMTVHVQAPLFDDKAYEVAVAREKEDAGPESRRRSFPKD